MKIIILTQDEPFYLADNIDYLLSHLPQKTKVVATVLFQASPFGGKKTFFQKIKETIQIFGLNFFLYYSLKMFLAKFNSNRKISKVLQRHKIPEIKLKKNINSKESVELLKSYAPDLLISIAGNQIFKKQIYNLAPLGCLNLHTSLLPKYRGLMPSFWVLKNNEKYTGVSVFFVNEGIDSGDIIVQKKIEIGNMTHAELIKHSKKIGMKAIIESIELIKDNKVKLIPNSDNDKTYFSFPTKADVKIFKKEGKKFF